MFQTSTYFPTPLPFLYHPLQATVAIQKNCYSEIGFNHVVQSQLEISFPQAAAQLMPMKICFVDYFYSISCYLSWISDSLLSGFKLSYLWVGTQMKPIKAWVKLQKFSIATVLIFRQKNLKEILKDYCIQRVTPILVHSREPSVKVIVQEPCAIYMAKWEIIARDFLTVAYISMNPA